MCLNIFRKYENGKFLPLAYFVVWNREKDHTLYNSLVPLSQIETKICYGPLYLRLSRRLLWSVCPNNASIASDSREYLFNFPHLLLDYKLDCSNLSERIISQSWFLNRSLSLFLSRRTVWFGDSNKNSFLLFIYSLLSTGAHLAITWNYFVFLTFRNQ